MVVIVKALSLVLGGTLVCSCGTRVDQDTIATHLKEKH